MASTNPVTPSSLRLPPGPPWYRMPEAFRRSPPEFLYQNFLRYGDIYRVRGAFTVYSINHPDYVRHVLTRAWPQFTKNTIDYKVIDKTLGRGLVTNGGPDRRDRGHPTTLVE